MPTPLVQYATVADLQAMGVARAALAKMPADDLNQQLTAASRKVDSYLRSQFTLPLFQVDQDVVEATVSIAAYYALTTRGYSPGTDNEEAISERKRDAIRWLEMVAAQKVVPNVLDSSPAAQQGRPSTRPRVVSGDPRGYSSRGRIDYTGNDGGDPSGFTDR